MYTPPSFPMARDVPRMGVIRVVHEASKLGFWNGHPDWCNLGRDQPDVGDMPGAPEPINHIDIAPADHAYGPVGGTGEVREALADMVNRTCRRGRSKYTADNVSFASGGRLALTRLYTILADGGEFRPLSLVMNEPGQSDNASGQRIFSKRTTRTVLKMMEETVDGNGTGTRARIPGLRVAGKTGTAQKADHSGRGYSRKRLASFGGIVPADEPRYVIYVMLDEPTTTGYGGAIAAPVFQKVASRTLAYNGYLPDVTFAMAEQAKERALTPAQREQRRKDAIYLANLAKYRAEKARKERERAQKMAEKALADNTLMPNLQGLTLRKTIETCVARGIIPTMEGSGTFVLRQSPAPGSRINEDSTCTVWLTDTPPDSENTSAAKE